MRVALVCAAFFLGATGGMAAGQPAEATVLVEDPAGDPRTDLQGQEVPDARWPEIDLRFLQVAESRLSLVFTLGVESLPLTDPARQFDYGRYVINLTVAGAPYAIEAFQTSPEYIWAYLCSKDSTSSPCHTYEQIGAAVQTESNSFVFALDKSLLTASSGRALHQGDILSEVSVTAQRHLGLADGRGPRDRMPDEGTAPGSWNIRYGPSASGHVTLSSPAPFRLSNGAATTYMFEIDVTNTGPTSELVELHVQDVPLEWRVNVAIPEIELGPQEMFTVPILATVPFRHDHGQFLSFDVLARTDSAAARAQIELGVLYSRVPQPAGHHNTLWLHEEGSPYLNAAKDASLPDEERTFPPPLATCEIPGPRGVGFSEMIPLVPGLQIGLDADMEKKGSATILLRSDVDAPRVSISGYLQVWGGDVEPSICPHETPEAAIMEIPQSQALAFPAGEEVEVKFPILPLPRGDLLPYQPEMYMGLLLIIWNEDGIAPHLPMQLLLPGNGLPKALPGSSFKLPLHEYHEPVTGTFGNLPDVSLISTDQERMVNPGETVLFNAKLRSGASKDVFLDLTGSNRHWATILGSAKLQLKSGQERDIFVQVAAPQGVSGGEVADLVLHVVDATDPRHREMVRLVATVDTTHDWPNDAEQARKVAGGQSAPSAGIVAALSVLAICAWRSRRG